MILKRAGYRVLDMVHATSILHRIHWFRAGSGSTTVNCSWHAYSNVASIDDGAPPVLNKLRKKPPLDFLGWELGLS